MVIYICLGFVVVREYSKGNSKGECVSLRFVVGVFFTLVFGLLACSRVAFL